MNCKKCGGKSTVKQTYSDRGVVPRNEYGTVARIRGCVNCKTTWTTTEIRDDSLDNWDFEHKAKQLTSKLKITKQGLQNLIRML